MNLVKTPWGILGIVQRCSVCQYVMGGVRERINTVRGMANNTP